MELLKRKLSTDVSSGLLYDFQYLPFLYIYI